MIDFKRIFYLMRHGQSEANVSGVIASRLVEGMLDPPLTPAGIKMVEERSRALLASNPGMSYEVIASPFLRTRQTASILCNVVGGNYSIDSRLRERDFGNYDRMSDENYSFVWQNDEQGVWLDTDLVEPPSAVFKRVDSLIQELNDNGRRESVVLCTHGDVASITISGYIHNDLCVHRKVGALETAEIRLLNREFSEGRWNSTK